MHPAADIRGRNVLVFLIPLPTAVGRRENTYEMPCWVVNCELYTKSAARKEDREKDIFGQKSPTCDPMPIGLDQPGCYGDDPWSGGEFTRHTPGEVV